MPLFNHLFGRGGSNPAKAAMPYLNEAKGVVNETYNPYIQRGNEAYGQLNPAYSQALQNPQEILGQFMQNYQPSGQYNYQHDLLSKSIGNTAAAGGYAGNPEHMRQQGELTQKLSSLDMQNWINNLMGIRNQGLQGLQGFNNQGFEAAGARSSDLGNILGSQGTLAYQEQVQKASKRNALIQQLMKALGAGTGAALAGPTGAIAGANAFGGGPQYSR